MPEKFFIMGFLLSLTPGPVLFKALQMGLARDKTLGQFLIGTYMGVAVIALVTIAGINMFSAFPYSRIIFILVNATILIWLGINSLKTQRSHFKSKQQKKHSHPFLNGFLLSVTSPSRWAVWISTAPLMASTSENTPQTIAFGLSFGLGSAVFFIILAYFSEKLGSHIRKGNFVYTARLAGLALIIFATISLLQI